MPTILGSSATPVLYLAFALTLLWLTARLIRPLSLPVAVVLGLLPCVFTGPALVTGGVYAPLDLPYASEPLASVRDEAGLTTDHVSRTRYDVAFRLIPWRKATRYAIKHLEWPLWNPFMLSGDVLAAAAEPAVYNPLVLVSHLLPLGPSLTFVAAAFFLVAGLCAFVFLRELGCGEAAAMIGTAGWMYSSFLLYWTGWPLSQTVAFFPLLLTAVRRIARAPGWRSAALLTAAFVLVAFAGHPESALHCVTVAAVYGLYELTAGRGPARPAIAWSLAAGVLALLLSAVYLLPVIEALPQAHQFRARHQIAGLVPDVPWRVALERLRTAVVSFAYGVPWVERIRFPRFEPQASSYIGSVLLAPALYGLWRSRRRIRWLLLGFVVCGLWLYVSAPGLTDLVERLPLSDVAVNHRLAFLAAFALTVFAALGCDAWIREPRPRLARRDMSWHSLGGWSLGGWSLGVLALLALAITLFWPGMRELGLAADFLRWRTLLEVVPVALAAALFLFVRPARLAVWGLLLVLLAQRWLQASELNPTYPQSVFVPAVEELAALPREGAPYRVAGVDADLRPNIATLYELEDVRGATPMTNHRLVWTHFLWAEPSPKHRHAATVTDLTRPFLSFLNVRFALVAKETPAPAGWRPFVAGRGFMIYKNPGVLPRAFVPERVRAGNDLPQMRLDMAAETDFSRVAWIELHGIGAYPPGEIVNGPGRVTTVERRGTGLYLEVEMEGHGWVVVSQTAWRGWRAVSAGREIAMDYANCAFLAIPLDAGRHQVELVYRPRAFVLGRAISFGTAGALAVLALGLALRRLQ